VDDGRQESDVQGTVGAASDSVEGRVAALARAEAASRGLVVLEVSVAGGRAPVVTVTVDVAVADQGRIADGAAPADPVDIDVIADLSRALDAALVAGSIVPEDATLEVSSPGVERPLLTAADLVRNLGREVEIEVDGRGDGLSEADAVRGRLVAVEDGTVALVAAGSEQRIELERVARARLVLPW
jgi:ribosome maturation factor RimP